MWPFRKKKSKAVPLLFDSDLERIAGRMINDLYKIGVYGDPLSPSEVARVGRAYLNDRSYAKKLERTLKEIRDNLNEWDLQCQDVAPDKCHWASQIEERIKEALKNQYP